MKCLFCEYEYKRPNPFVTNQEMISIVIKHMEDTHEEKLEYLEEKLVTKHLVDNQNIRTLKKLWKDKNTRRIENIEIDKWK